MASSVWNDYFAPSVGGNPQLSRMRKALSFTVCSICFSLATFPMWAWMHKRGSLKWNTIWREVNSCRSSGVQWILTGHLVNLLVDLSFVCSEEKNCRTRTRKITVHSLGFFFLVFFFFFSCIIFFFQRMHCAIFFLGRRKKQKKVVRPSYQNHHHQQYLNNPQSSVPPDPPPMFAFFFLFFSSPSTEHPSVFQQSPVR